MPSLSREDASALGPAADADPLAQLGPINRSFGEATRALERVQMLGRSHALPGMRQALRQLQLRLAAYLEATAGAPAMGAEPTAQMLRALLSRLEEEVEGDAFERFGSCAVDLGDELASHHRACVGALRP